VGTPGAVGVSARRTVPSQRTGRDAISVASWTTVSRVVGLVRWAVIAAVLGPTYLGNTYQATNFIPNLVYELFTGSLFASLVVPPLVKHIAGEDLRRARTLAGGVLTIVAGGLAVTGALVVAAGPIVLHVLALGVNSAAVTSAQVRVGWILLAMFMPQVVLYGVAGVAAAVQNSRGSFALPAAAPALESAGMIATLMTAGAIFGTHVSIGTVTTAELIVLGLGTTASVGLHAGAQWLGARRVGVSLRPQAGWRDPEARAIARRAVASVGYAGLNAGRIFGSLVVANAVPGGVVAFQLALNFFYLPIAVGARPVSTALLPQLAGLFHDKEYGRFEETLRSAMGVVVFVTLPVMMLYMILAPRIADGILVGNRAESASNLVAAALICLAPGILGEASFVLSTQASYASYDIRAPLNAMILRTGISAAGMGVAIGLGPSARVLAGLGVALSVGNLVSAGQLQRHIRLRLKAERHGLGPSVGRHAAATGGAAITAYLIQESIPAPVGSLGEWVVVCCASVGGLIVFVGVEALLKSPELAAILHGARVSFDGGRR
jgi:putative peptidoglycan lipid II flippase